jgi:hypothetical protein
VNAERWPRIPRARLEIVKRSGHLFLWDEAKRLAVRVARILDAGAGRRWRNHYAARLTRLRRLRALRRQARGSART